MNINIIYFFFFKSPQIVEGLYPQLIKLLLLVVLLVVLLIVRPWDSKAVNLCRWMKFLTQKKELPYSQGQPTLRSSFLSS